MLASRRRLDRFWSLPEPTRSSNSAAVRAEAEISFNSAARQNRGLSFWVDYAAGFQHNEHSTKRGFDEVVRTFEAALGSVEDGGLREIAASARNAAELAPVADGPGVSVASPCADPIPKFAQNRTPALESS